jgi:mono/diheme cytochrome c family protein
VLHRRPQPPFPLAAFLAVAAVLAALAGGVAWAQPAGGAATTAAGWRDGAEVYAKVCQHCHESGVAPGIRGRNLAPALVTLFVRRGSRAMPAFRAAEIDDDALAQLGEWISKS